MRQTHLLLTYCFVIVISSACRHATTPAALSPLANLSQPVRLSSSNEISAEPAIAAAPDGSIYVAWVEHRGKNADVMLDHRSAEGSSISQPVRVNSQAGEATAWRGDPPTLAVADDGTVHVGWTKRTESESGHGADVYVSTSRDGGRTFSPAAKVNDDQGTTSHGMHSMGVARDGRLYVVWLDERNVTLQPMTDGEMKTKSSGHHMESNREVFISYSADGGRSFTPNKRVAANACPCCKTSVAVAGDGRVYLSWRQVLSGDYRHIAVSSSADGGQTFSDAVIVSDDQWMLKGCPVTGAALAVDGNNKLLVLWYAAGEKGQHGIYWSESNDQGRTFAPRQLLAATRAEGTPTLVAELKAAPTAIWQGDVGGEPQVLATPFNPSGRADNKISTAGKGQTPVAVETNDRYLIAIVAKEGDKQGVWLLNARR